MGVRFIVEIENVAVIDRAFNRIKDHANDFRPIWGYVKPVFFKIEREQFDSEGGAGQSGKWKELSSPYKEIKRKDFPDAKILERTKAMRDSLTKVTGDTVIEGRRRSLTLGSSIARARWHHKGMGNLPERKVIDMTRRQKRRIQKAIQQGLLDILRGDGEVTRGIEVS